MARRFPRWLVLLSTPIAFLIVHVGAPWAVSLLSARHGWIDGRPGPWNLVALAVVAIGSAVIWWGAGLHMKQVPETVRIEATPHYLLRGGPYLYSRNPIYLGVLTTWFGWGLFYGSASVAVTVGAEILIVSLIVVPWEERNLEGRFGESYLDYKRRVPRWLL